MEALIPEPSPANVRKLGGWISNILLKVQMVERPAQMFPNLFRIASERVDKLANVMMPTDIGIM
ncbi:hypothetical protein QJS10_CPB20g00597 [Acorus calamus]|uniref:Uncharacterized protein n=1 Tax=Acorus calamus TaxID=4465 RepID=A0AAV9C8F1_ACOCL|nr:hypothetical protein QJS10_CPB20g00597 [Acorus calamus]